MPEITKARQLKLVRLPQDLKHVEINFLQILEIPPSHPENQDSETKKIPCSIRPPFRPASSFVSALKNLREYALDYAGIELADKSKAIKEWTVSSIQLKGDHNLHQARVLMTLQKKGKYSDKPLEMPLGEITMYPTADDKMKYPNYEKLTAAVEDLIAEVWEYLDGNHETGRNPQLALDLFPKAKSEAVTI